MKIYLDNAATTPLNQETKKLYYIYFRRLL